MKEPTNQARSTKSNRLASQQQAHRDFHVRPVAFAGNGVWSLDHTIQNRTDGRLNNPNNSKALLIRFFIFGF
jgi:hypothetical protein